MYLDKIKRIFETEITFTLLTQQFGQDDEIVQKRAELNASIKNLFIELNLFILSGDYVDIHQIEKIIQTIDSSLNELISKFEVEPEEQEFILSNFFLPIKHSLGSLKEIKFFIEKRISGGNNEILIEGRRELGLQVDIYNLKNQIGFFNINCKVAIIDHSLAVKKKQLEDLIIYIIELGEIFSNHPLKEILLDKSKLLCAKISQRFKDDEKSYLYSFEFKDNEISKFEDELVIFNNFVDSYRSHYLAKNERNRKIYIDKIHKSAKTEGYDLLKFHSLIKNYKDDNESIVQIENLLSVFESSYDESIKSLDICEYDKKAWAICKNYLYNNKLSLQLKLQPSKLDKNIALLEEIKVIQEETGVKNYFPFLQFLKTIYAELIRELDNSRPEFAKLQELIDLYDKYIKRLFLSFEWSKDNNFQAFVLNKDLCRVEYETASLGKRRLFIASSFVLPQNYMEISIEINDLKKSVDEIRAHIPLFRRILAEEDQLLGIRFDIEKHNRNQIEILGIFSAVVLFAAGGINIFKESPSIEQAAKFGLIFSYSLSVFVLLIWLITRDYSHFKISKLHVFFTILYSLTTYIIFAISFNFWPFCYV